MHFDYFWCKISPLMTESFLHFVWKYRLYSKEIKTSGNQRVIVSHPGQHNKDSGPDFFDARLTIGSTRWAGNVEIHVHSSDWSLHGHQNDPAYDGIILHVVYIDDEPLKDRQANVIPCLELCNYLDEKLFFRYQAILDSQNKIPCSKLLQHAPAITIASWLERMLISRMENKCDAISALMKYNKGDYEESFYQWMARSFGFKTNSQPFEMLARSLPRKILLHHSFSPLQIEALVFGQAGLLDTIVNDSYPKLLQSEYFFLKNKFQLKSLSPALWKFMRLRPFNFPTIRLAQWAALMSKNRVSLSDFIVIESVEGFYSLLEIEPDAYWDNHFQFDKIAPFQKKTLGRASSDLIIINTLIPFLFYYAVQRGMQHNAPESLELMRKLPAEQNNVISLWEKSGIHAENAGDSQALMELYNRYCSLKKCLDCAIGVCLLR